MKNIVKLAFKIASKEHKGQTRRDCKTPYISHPVEVANKFKSSDLYGKMSETLQAIALLHDVIEDSNHKLSIVELNEMGIPAEITDVVWVLTHFDTQDYLDYILEVHNNLLATMVKVEDIKHNLSTLEKGNKDKRDKYMMALYILEN
jgi:(p)ppGpp synthase/HD superfamily hydrolase